MKTLAMTVLISGLLSTGVAFAADSKHQHDCKAECATHCGQSGTFEPLFPQYEKESPIGG